MQTSSYHLTQTILLPSHSKNSYLAPPLVIAICWQKGLRDLVPIASGKQKQKEPLFLLVNCKEDSTMPKRITNRWHLFKKKKRPEDFPKTFLAHLSMHHVALQLSEPSHTAHWRLGKVTSLFPSRWGANDFGKTVSVQWNMHGIILIARTQLFNLRNWTR